MLTEAVTVLREQTKIKYSGGSSITAFLIHYKIIGDDIMHKDIRFATQMALLNQLYKNKFITEQEYKAILKTIKNDYNIPQIELTS